MSREEEDFSVEEEVRLDSSRIRGDSVQKSGILRRFGVFWVFFRELSDAKVKVTGFSCSVETSIRISIS